MNMMKTAKTDIVCLNFRMNASVALSCALVIALAVHVKSGSPVVSYHVSITSREDSCQRSKCFQRHQQLTCDDCIPSMVPGTVNEIILNSLHGYHLVAHRFCQFSWTNVTKLSIFNDLDDQSAITIGDYAFDCLNKIENLKLSIRKFSNVTTNTFYGLLNIISLDLTDCSRLETPALTLALFTGTVASKLNKLILTNMGSVFDGIQLSQELIDALAQRNITELNLSSSYVEFKNVLFGRLCETLQILNVSNTRILSISSIPRGKCRALKVLDISRTQFPRTILLHYNVTRKNYKWIFDHPWFEFFSQASLVYFNGMVSRDHYVYYLNSTFTIAANNSITEFHFAGQNMPICELEFIFHPNYLTYLDISDNRIERLGVNSFRSLKFLKKLDLSDNKLRITSKETFTELFCNNAQLMSLNLANNDIEWLPQNVFEFNTELMQVNLKGNRMTQIHFQISHLTSLINIDFRSNLIEYLDASSMRQLDILYDMKQALKKETRINQSFYLDIRDNPFTCNCKALDFIVWFVNSPIVEDSRDDYHCEMDDQRITMNANAVATSKADCNKLRKMLISTLAPCITLSIVIAVSFLMFKRYRYLKSRQKVQRKITQILEEKFEFRFPVFLSYSSENSEFVEQHIHLPLKVSYIDSRTF